MTWCMLLIPGSIRSIVMTLRRFLLPLYLHKMCWLFRGIHLLLVYNLVSYLRLFSETLNDGWRLDITSKRKAKTRKSWTSKAWYLFLLVYAPKIWKYNASIPGTSPILRLILAVWLFLLFHILKSYYLSRMFYLTYSEGSRDAKNASGRIMFAD